MKDIIETILHAANCVADQSSFRSHHSMHVKHCSEAVCIIIQSVSVVMPDAFNCVIKNKSSKGPSIIINVFPYEQNSRKGGRGGQKAKKNVGFRS